MEKFNTLNIEDEEIGFCIVPRKKINNTNVHNNTDTEICVYIPKLMSEIEMENKPYIKNISNISSKMIINDDIPVKFPTSIKVCNFVRTEPLDVSNISSSFLAPAERCIINFKNNDIKQPLYTKNYNETNKRKEDIYEIFAPNGDDKLPYSFTLNTIDKIVSLYLTDQIQLIIDEKLKQFKLSIEESVIEATDKTLKTIFEEIEFNSNEFKVYNKTKLEDLYVKNEKIESMIRRIAKEVCNSVK